jgi:hypothetical protein
MWQQLQSLWEVVLYGPPDDQSFCAGPKSALVAADPEWHDEMRLHVASHTGTLSLASRAIHDPPLPPLHAGADTTKLPSKLFPMGASIFGIIVLGAPLLSPGLRDTGLLVAGWGQLG